MNLYFIVNVDWFFLSHRLPLALAAQKKGYIVTVIAQDTGRGDEIRNYGLNFMNLPIHRGKTSVLNELKTLLYLFTFFLKKKNAIVHLVGLKIILLGSIAHFCAASKTKLVNALSGAGTMFTEDKPLPIVFKLLLKLFDLTARTETYYIFQNQDDLQLFRTITSKIIHFKIIKGSGVDLEKFAFTETSTSFPRKILFIGRLLKEKGITELVEAAKQLQEEFDGKIKFQILGDVDFHNPSSLNIEYIHKNTVEKYLEWEGHVKHINNYLEQSYIVVLPSYREGIPKSLIEACAVGRAIITTDSIGCREVVKNGHNGILVPVKKINELANAIKLLINDEGLVKKMGLSSRYLAEREFDVEVVVRETLDIYNSLI